MTRTHLRRAARYLKDDAIALRESYRRGRAASPNDVDWIKGCDLVSEDEINSMRAEHDEKLVLASELYKLARGPR